MKMTSADRLEKNLAYTEPREVREELKALSEAVFDFPAQNEYYWKPIRVFKHLKKENYETGEIEGDANIAIIFSNRGGGKTVNVGIELLKRWEQYRERCMVLCRTQSQQREGYIRAFWHKVFKVDDDEGYLNSFRQIHEIDMSNNAFLKIDGDVFCYCEGISGSEKVRNTGSYDNCRNIVIDEVISFNEGARDNGQTPLQRIWTIWETVARGYKNATDVTNMIMMANISRYNNWLIQDLALTDFIDEKTKFTCQRGIVYEKFINTYSQSKLANSTMGLIMEHSRSGQQYFAANQKNEYTDTFSTVVKLALNFDNLLYQFSIRDRTFGLFQITYSSLHYEEGKWVRSPDMHIAKIDKVPGKVCFATDVTSVNVSQGETMAGMYELIKMLQNMIKRGTVSFQTYEARDAVYKLAGFKV